MVLLLMSPGLEAQALEPEKIKTGRINQLSRLIAKTFTPYFTHKEVSPDIVRPSAIFHPHPKNRSSVGAA
jgi:hypothetical protein